MSDTFVSIRRHAVTLLMTCAASLAPLRAQVVVGAPQTTSVGPFTRGPAGFASFGQSFASPALATQLTNVTFSLTNYSNGAALRFDVYLYLFDAVQQRVTAPALWSALGVAGSGNDFTFDSRTLGTGGLSVSGGTTLLLFLTAANQAGNPDDAANLVGASEFDVYDGGSFFLASSGTYADLLQTGAFTRLNGVSDAAFSATFQVGAQVVPEPGSVPLLYVGTFVLLVISRRARRATLRNRG